MGENLEHRIIEWIKQNGPLTGLELKRIFQEDNLVLWQTCMRSDNLTASRVGTRYMRLDYRIDGFACLSPSILREFFSYTVIGLVDDPAPTIKKANEIAAHIEKVSSNKLNLAHRIVSDIRSQCGGMETDKPRINFILAGDIVYRMAHDVPRPEKSTGKLVKGSDIDLIVVVEDEASDDFVKRLDDAIYSEKYRMLTTPAYHEEIDYVVKKMNKVREQVQFDTFKSMIACKILGEGLLLFGSEDLFLEIKTLLKTQQVMDKLLDLEKMAHTSRKNAEDYLLHADPKEAKVESLDLFYPHEESEEFE